MNMEFVSEEQRLWYYQYYAMMYSYQLDQAGLGTVQSEPSAEGKKKMSRNQRKRQKKQELEMLKQNY
jgi:hypothetical protein